MSYVGVKVDDAGVSESTFGVIVLRCIAR